MLQKYYKLFLLLFFIIALTLRWWYLPANAISFAYDQARDAFVVQEILGGHLKVLGPSVSGIPGLFHGVLYYYVIAPAYAFAHGNPIGVAYYLSFLSSLGVVTVYYFSYLLTKKVAPALLSALIFAFSFEASQYANLLTNASMGVWFAPIIYIGLYLWITKSSKWAPVVTGLGLGLSIQSEMALGYHLVPVVFWLLVSKEKISRQEIIKFILSFVVAVSSMIISEIKFGFTGLQGIYYLLSSQDGISKGKEFSDFVSTYLNQTSTTLAYTIFPINIVFGGLAGFMAIIYSLLDKLKERKGNILSWQTFLASYILVHFIALPFGGWNMRHVMVGAVAGICVFLGIFIWKYISKSKIALIITLVVILGSNTSQILKENKNGQTIFPLQLDLVLSKELEAVDYSYQKSDGKEFSISTLTSPLFVNTLWSYLYNWHGKEKYGYVPFWVGRDQVGQLGNNLQFASGNVSKHFFIMEPTYGIPELYVTYAKGDNDAMSNLVNKKLFGEIVVEERESKNVK